MSVSSTTTKVSYSGDGSQTVFAYTFKIFAAADLRVIERASNGTETVKTLTTDYTVSGVGTDGGGNVTFVTAPASNVTVVIKRSLGLTQGTDYIDNDPFPAESHEDALDRLTFIAQNIQEQVDRCIKASETNTLSGSEFTIGASDRANKIFAFDASGNVNITQEIGTFRGSDATTTTAAYNVRDLIKSTTAGQLNNIYICTATSVVGDLLTDTTHFELLVDAYTAATSATNAANSAAAAATSATQATTNGAAQVTLATAQVALATTQATNAATSETNSATSATNAATSETNAATSATAAQTAQAAAEAALDTFDDRFLGAKATDPTLDNDGNALLDGALYFDTTNNALKVYDLGNTQWNRTTPTSSDQTNINTVGGISANVTTVAGISANVTTVAGDSADIGTLAAISSDVSSLANALGASTTYTVTVSAGVYYLDGVANPILTFDRGNTYIFDLSDSSNTGHPLAFKDGSGNSYTTGVTTTGTAGSSGAQVQIDVDNAAPAALRYYCTVHGNGMGNTITVVNSNLALVASNITSVNSVAAISSNVSAVGAVAANVTTVANNLTNVNNFADTYFVSGSAPSSPTTGDLWFDSTNNIMKVYGGSGFQNAGSSVNGTAQRSSYTATAGQTTFAATYDAGYVDVYLNGIKLINGTDFTATSGTSIVLSSGAAVNDTVDIIGYGTFLLSNFSINDANDVNTSGISNGQVLAYNSTSSDFEPATITSDLVDDTTPQLGADLDTNGNAIAFGTSKWTIELSTDDLIFKYNGVAKIKFASDGEIVTVDDVTAFGTI